MKMRRSLSLIGQGKSDAMIRVRLQKLVEFRESHRNLFELEFVDLKLK
jgi:hypothetical protein